VVVDLVVLALVVVVQENVVLVVVVLVVVFPLRVVLVPVVMVVGVLGVVVREALFW
jgi:hypothetical protein